MKKDINFDNVVFSFLIWLLTDLFRDSGDSITSFLISILGVKLLPILPTWPSLNIFCSPEPKTHWWAYRIGRPPTSVHHRRPHSLKPSSQKPLGQSKSNFIWSFYWMREQKFVQMVLVTWKDGHHDNNYNMVKTLKNLLWDQKADYFETWYAASGT